MRRDAFLFAVLKSMLEDTRKRYDGVHWFALGSTAKEYEPMFYFLVHSLSTKMKLSLFHNPLLIVGPTR